MKTGVAALFAALLAAGCGSGSKAGGCVNGVCTGDAGGNGGGGGSGGGQGGSGQGGAGGGQGGGSGAGGQGGGGAPDAPLADLDMELFKCTVEPIFDRGCGMMGCHGTDGADRQFRVYTRGRWRNDEMVDNTGTCLKTGKVNLQKEGSGTVMCEGWLPHTRTEWQKNFDSARWFMRQGMDPETSDLLVQPKRGGRGHVGVHLFAQGDADYEAIRKWLAGGKYGGTCDTMGN